MRKARILSIAAIFAVSLAITGTAMGEWTPTQPGDPRTCGSGHTPVECASAAASFAFRAKYQRVTGHSFANTLRCTQTGASVLVYSCAWGTPAKITPVRFARKRAGWKASVGVIAP